MAKAKKIITMVDHGCKGMILQLFYYFLSEFRKRHLEHVRACIKTIMSITLDEGITIKFVGILDKGIQNLTHGL